MLSPVPKGRRAIAAQASKLARTGGGDDGIGLPRHAVLEYSSALEHEGTRLPANLLLAPLGNQTSSPLGK